MFEQGLQDYNQTKSYVPHAMDPLKQPPLEQKIWRRQWLGEVPYLEALKHQQELRGAVRERGQGVIIGLEHPRVITLGLRMSHENLEASKGSIPIVKTDRGGQATLHNPGQLVIYPILPIRAWNISVREYVHLLLQTTESFCNKCNIIIIHKNNGIYSKNGKIASIGINIKRGTSSHGVAINISNSLKEFSLISPCGVAGQAMDRVADYKKITLLEGFEMWCSEFQRLISAK